MGAPSVEAQPGHTESVRLRRSGDAGAALPVGRDIWVLNKPQNHFVQLVKDGGGEANIVRFPESRHEIFSMPNSTYKPYLEKILGFYDDPMIACAAY